jgi:cytochrome c-type protein NapC
VPWKLTNASCFTREKTCIDCHKGIAHHLPDMRNVPGWQ